MVFLWRLSDSESPQVCINFSIPLQGRVTYYHIINIFFFFTPIEFFTLALANGFSLEFEWQQVSSSLQDSSQYSGRSQ